MLNRLIGVSLSELHTSVTAFVHAFVLKTDGAESDVLSMDLFHYVCTYLNQTVLISVTAV